MVDTPPEQLAEAGRRLRQQGRGVRVRFGSLGRVRKLPPEEVKKAAEALRMDPRRAKMGKALYGKHPALTNMGSAHGKVKRCWESETLPYPEPGVRIYVLRSAIPPGASKEEVVQIHARELEGFMKRMQEAIDQYHEAVRHLRDEWPDVLQQAREELIEQFNPDEYPDPELLPEMLQCTCEPVNLRLPEEYRHMSAEERRLRLAAYDAKFQEAAQMQAEVVTKLLEESLASMMDSVTAFRSGNKTRFYDSTVDRVFTALKEFRERALAFGILRGTDLAEEFQRLEDILHGGDGSGNGRLSEDELPDFLRGKSGEGADSLLGRLEEAQERISQMLAPKRRSIIRPRDRQADAQETSGG